MKLNVAAIALVTVASLDSSSKHSVAAFAPSSSQQCFFTRNTNVRSELAVLSTVEDTATATEVLEESNADVPVDANASADVAISAAGLDSEFIASLSFRELQRECKARGLPAVGNTASLRTQLRDLLALVPVPVPLPASESDSSTTDPEGPTEEEMCAIAVEFCDESDPNFDFNDLLNQVMETSTMGHWKAATRKLKKLKKKHATPERPIPHSAYDSTLRACVEERLHGARAAEPARKILEEMAESDYEIATDVCNNAVQNCLGEGPNGTHDGCGGIDTALAMLSAIESSPNGGDKLTVDTYGKVVHALTADGAIDEALLLLRAMVVEHSFTPPLETFADVAKAASKDDAMADKVLNVLVFAKAAGYELDKIASTKDGRSILASGVIAAEKLNNLALGLRLLTAAAGAEGCAPDRGDDLVASSSSAAQRASTLIHRRAISKAVEDSSWKLAVKLLMLMRERSLTPSPAVWRNVVTCCAKCEKSKKATALLLDWVKLSNKVGLAKPSVNVFNTVVNACEICGEEELTLVVLNAMKKTHGTEGNLITLNIALKRLAKQHNNLACEGLIISMLKNGMEPNVVTYTTAIAACAGEPKNSQAAYEWLKRMRSRRVKPNYHTYNTALASCLDGTLESTRVGSQIADEMLVDVSSEMVEGLKGKADLKSVLPDTYTRLLAIQLGKQLRENWRIGDIDIEDAKATLRVPLLKLVDFNKSEVAKEANEMDKEIKAAMKADEPKSEEEGVSEKVSQDEETLEYSVAKSTHRIAEV